MTGDDRFVANAIGVAILAGAVIASAWIDASTPRPRACIREFISPPTLAAGDRCMSIEDFKSKQERIHHADEEAAREQQAEIRAIVVALEKNVPSTIPLFVAATQIYWLQRVSRQIEELIHLQRRDA